MTNTLVANEPTIVRLSETKPPHPRRERPLDRLAEETRRTWNRWLAEMRENAD